MMFPKETKIVGVMEYYYPRESWPMKETRKSGSHTRQRLNK